MMLQKTAWAIALLLLVAQFAPAQPDGAPKQLPTLPTPESAESVMIPNESPRYSNAYATADYLFWWYHRGPSPTLLTTAPNNGITSKGLTGGILGEEGTVPLFTSNNLDYHGTSGFSLAAGISLDCNQFWVFEGAGFYLPRRSITFRATGNADGTPLLTVPFLDASSGQQQALDISSQDIFGTPVLTGSMTIQSDITLWGYELNLLARTIRTADRSVELFGGFRALGLDENLRIAQSIVALQDGALSLQFPAVGLGQPAGGTQGYYAVPAGGVVTILDAFSARNRFYGAQFGGRFLWDYGPLRVGLTGKVAVGATHQEVGIGGLSTASSGSLAGGPAVPNLITPGGMFALQNNSGSFSQNQFTIAPEIGLNLDYAVTSWLSVRFGYSALYWSNVVRPGAQIDTVLNSKLVPTAGFLPFQVTPAGGLPPVPGAFAPGQEQGRPYFAFRDTAFWAHGLHFGVELRY